MGCPVALYGKRGNKPLDVTTVDCCKKGTRYDIFFLRTSFPQPHGVPGLHPLLLAIEATPCIGWGDRTRLRLDCLAIWYSLLAVNRPRPSKSPADAQSCPLCIYATCILLSRYLQLTHKSSFMQALFAFT